MPVRVGIPRALYYHRYRVLWHVFLTELGAEVLVSEPTSKQIMDAGISCCVNEACLPVKIFHGHMESLKTQVDRLFVPRLTSISRDEYVCPKLGGLPDMLRSSIRDLPPLLDHEVNLRKSPESSWQSAKAIGKELCSDPYRVRRAYEMALTVYRGVRRMQISGMLNLGSQEREQVCSPKFRIAMLGHSYLLNDPYASMNILKKLKSKGVKLITTEEMDPRIIREQLHCNMKQPFWNHAREIMGSLSFLLQLGILDGVMYITAFGCGIDAFVEDMAARMAKGFGSGIPWIRIVLDEHSGEAGTDTRLEAFLDMMEGRKSHAHHFSPNGEYLYPCESHAGRFGP
ncbi:MAG TPA: hypothetical protein DD727_03595 [Clostridiales bacterium]|nr:hypothetical protein [Clostridiales bacterium]